MKIMQIANSIDRGYGGPVTVIEQLVTELAKRKVEIEVVAPSSSFNSDKISVDGVKATQFKKNFLANFWPGYSRELRKYVEKSIHEVDLIHIHELWTYPNFMAYKLAKKYNKPFVITVHGELDPWAVKQKKLKKKVYMKLIQKRILNEANIIHTITNEGTTQVIKQGIKSETFMIPNGIDVNKYKNLPDSSEFLNLYPELRGKKVLLFMGRIHPKKGLDILAPSFRDLLNEFPDTRLVIAGPDEQNYSQEIKKILKDNNVLEKTIFTGMLDGTVKLSALASADVFTLPSYSEGFSMAILEALASKIPVVISDKCYFPEVSKKEAGIVIEASKLELSKALTSIFKHKNEWRKMGENGFDLVNENYNWEVIANDMKKLYEKII